MTQVNSQSSFSEHNIFTEVKERERHLNRLPVTVATAAVASLAKVITKITPQLCARFVTYPLERATVRSVYLRRRVPDLTEITVTGLGPALMKTGGKYTVFRVSEQSLQNVHLNAFTKTTISALAGALFSLVTDYGFDGAMQGSFLKPYQTIMRQNQYSFVKSFLAIMRNTPQAVVATPFFLAFQEVVSKLSQGNLCLELALNLLVSPLKSSLKISQVANRVAQLSTKGSGTTVSASIDIHAYIAFGMVVTVLYQLGSYVGKESVQLIEGLKKTC